MSSSLRPPSVGRACPDLTPSGKLWFEDVVSVGARTVPARGERFLKRRYVPPLRLDDGGDPTSVCP